MKKFLLLLGTMFLLASCTKEEETMTASQQPDMAAMAPPIYGYAMLKDVPETRGVANKMKVWNKTMAKEELSVKFLNGSEVYKEFVKEVAQEWEEVADVRFHFLEDNTKDAMIRIGFDKVPGMQSSWSYTGTDHTYLIDDQDEPTMHFARWRRVSDECKRSDVLRAFGQVLGLELEFRHPEFYPAWITNEDGTIDEASIRTYWEEELAEFISWAELKTMVLDPINVSVRFIAKTDAYDQNSVMCWPFYERIALNINPIDFDSDYNTELSALDKSFIESLYGASTGSGPGPHEFFPLIEFNYTGTMPSFKVTTTKNLGVIWNADTESDVITRYDLPSNTTEFTTTISHTYTSAEKRKIVIGQILGYKEEMPTSSTALKLFDFTKAVGAEDIVIKPYNQALETVWIRGGSGFIAQDFNFAANEYIKKLYLIGTLGSTVNVDNCKNLELLSTTPTIYKPIVVEPLEVADTVSYQGTIIGEPIEPIVPIIPQPVRLPWPYSPMDYYSLGNSEGNGVNIYNCKQLKTISLDNTAITNISFAGKDNLEYVYLSSTNGIAGGGTPKGAHLLSAVNSLPSRAYKTKGQIIVRHIGLYLVRLIADANTDTDTDIDIDKEIIRPPLKSEYRFEAVSIDRATLNQIESVCAAKNWEIVWAKGTTVIN